MRSTCHPIRVLSRRRALASIEREHGDAHILDLTSRAPEPWCRFSPFYPHGNIPIPLSPGHSAQSVEGIWQGLKVFESAGIDASKFAVTAMKGIKRTVRKHGRVLGPAAGVGSDELLGYREARFRIYLPAYLWVLEECVNSLLDELHELRKRRELVFLDYETNCDPEKLEKPLSHAGLVRAFLDGAWPQSP